MCSVQVPEEIIWLSARVPGLKILLSTRVPGSRNTNTRNRICIRQMNLSDCVKRRTQETGPRLAPFLPRTRHRLMAMACRARQMPSRDGALSLPLLRKLTCRRKLVSDMVPDRIRKTQWDPCKQCRERVRARCHVKEGRVGEGSGGKPHAATLGARTRSTEVCRGSSDPGRAFRRPVMHQGPP